ncbi:murein L,D-transpeptidase catalytic domain family protein [Sphingomonas sp. KC8]|uniref:murein L,D-transpeptidase catalytic domain family protein n=1 Tax=Sphingomonas sp. KC8 TaxID=1030157 RepID=UPI000248AB5B|nr:murein L,D-transpeptidase catalytic domain family protein [Sphingomonas sp. KC8]
MIASRREFLLAGGAALLLAQHGTALAATTIPGHIDPALFRRALRALQNHGSRLLHRDRIGIVDFSRVSRVPRFHIVDMASGRSTALLVAHGRGSDPDHRGWVERFSNQPGSLASSAGAYATGDLYIGRHGLSRRLIGLDTGNSNAEARAIVIHAAPYVCPEIIAQTGKLGRSEGCFAFQQTDLDAVLDRLGPGRLIYAGKI